MIHQLKLHPRYFEMTLIGRKPWELRKDDRGFMEGDQLLMREWDPEAPKRPDGSLHTGSGSHGKGEYTGRSILVNVTYVLRGPGLGLDAGHVIMTTALRSLVTTPELVQQ